MTPPAPDPVVGTVLKGTYRVDRRIAAGGMGVIYQASHVRLPKKYAIKVLTRDLARNEQVIARFRREAEIVAALGHPHIVDVVDFDALDSGEMYMVMEFLDGEDLADRLRRGPLSLASTVRVFMDVCDALDRAHAEGIVHRDLKPANIFLISQSGRDDYAKVLDFGISKILEAAGTQMTLEQSIMGTPSYMAPEQAAGAIHEIDHRTDVFALGAILYECLTGQMAFPGTTPFAVIQKITGEPPPRLAAAAPHLPAALDEVVQRAMARAKADRFASAGALCQALIAAAGVPSAELGRVVTGTDHARTAPTRTSAPAGAVVESTLSAAASEREGEQAIATVGARERRGRAGLWIAAGAVAAAGAAAAVMATRAGAPRPAAGAGDAPAGPAATAESRPPAGGQPAPALESLGRLLPVPGGTFYMGTDAPTAQFERPRHRVQVASFWLAETETTNADYALYLRRRPNVPKPTGWPSRDQFPDGEATLPVVGIDWESAASYCAWAYPNGGRLPTEEEWEWAARGPESHEFVGGDELPANGGNYGPYSRGRLAPVGSFPAGKTRDGLLDMGGNAYEWTASWLRFYDGRDIGKWRGRRVLRGGSFKTVDGDALRAWYRNFDVPAKTSDEIGFRCAWSPQ